MSLDKMPHKNKTHSSLKEKFETKSTQDPIHSLIGIAQSKKDDGSTKHDLALLEGQA